MKETSAYDEAVKFLTFPPNFDKHNTSYDYTSNSTLIILAKNATKELYDEFAKYNPDLDLIFMNGALYVNDPEEDHSPIHEFGLHIFNGALVRYNTRLMTKFQLKRPPIAAAGQTTLINKEFCGSPDASFRVSKRVCQEPNVIFEVSYGIGLKRSVEKIEAYFTQFPGILEAVLIDIEYEWPHVVVQGRRQYHRQQGKMVAYHYRRMDFVPGQSIRPSRALCFGNTPLTTEEVLQAKMITGVDKIVRDLDNCCLVLSGTSLHCCMSSGSGERMEEDVDLDLVIDLCGFRESVLQDGLDVMQLQQVYNIQQ